MLKGSKVGGRGGDMLSPDRFPTGSTVGSGTEGMAASGVSFASSVPEASFSEAGISDATDSTVAGTDGVTFSISVAGSEILGGSTCSIGFKDFPLSKSCTG